MEEELENGVVADDGVSVIALESLSCGEGQTRHRDERSGSALWYHSS